MKKFVVTNLFLFLICSTTIASTQSNSSSLTTKQNRFEIRTAPVAFLAQWLTIDLTYLLNKNWAIGPSYVGYENKSELGGMLAPTYLGKALGFHFIYADTYFQDSYYVGGHFYSEDYRSRPHAYPGYYNNKGTRGNVVAGRRWVSGNYSSMLGFGVESKDIEFEKVPKSGAITTDRDNYTFWHIEFKIGMLF